MDKIIDGLYLGDIRAAANLFLLKSHVSVGHFVIVFRELRMCCRCWQG